MTGREYADYTTALLSESKRLVDSSRKKGSVLLKTYVKAFGIPEIGFQLRDQYFNRLTKKLQIRGSILDAGSGIGVYALKMAKRYPASDVFGVDIEKQKLELAKKIAKRKRIKNVTFSEGDLEDLKIKQKYDLIVSIDVLEHVENFEKVFKNFSKSMNTGGYLYIHVPLRKQKRIFKRLKDWEHDEHKREGFTMQLLIGLLKKNNFKIVEKKKTFGFLGKLSWEIQIILLKKNFILAGFFYPVLYYIAYFDQFTKNKSGLCAAILAKKNNRK